MTRPFILICIVLLTVVPVSFSAYAQEQEDSGAAPDVQEEVSSESKAEEVAKQLADPNANIGFLTFPMDLITYDGDLPDASSQSAFKLNFQPSLPYKLSEGVNLFVRPLFPIIFKQPVYDPTSGFEDKGVDLGNISMDVAVGKSWKSGLVTLFGVAAAFPTATDDALGSKDYLLGPEFVIGKVGDWGSVYVLLYHSRSITDADERESVEITGGQYFYTINLKNAWQIQGQPTFTYNHNAADGSKWTFPIGGGISKTTVFGKLPVKFGVQYWYYLARDKSFGPQHQIRFLTTLVVPLPW